MWVSDQEILKRTFEYYNNIPNAFGKMTVNPSWKLNHNSFLSEEGIFQALQFHKTHNTVQNNIVTTITAFIKDIITNKEYASQMTSENVVYNLLNTRLGFSIEITKKSLQEALQQERISPKASVKSIEKEAPVPLVELPEGTVNQVPEEIPNHTTTTHVGHPRRKNGISPKHRIILNWRSPYWLKSDTRKGKPQRGFVENKNSANQIATIKNTRDNAERSRLTISLLGEMEARLINLWHYAVQSDDSALPQNNSSYDRKAYNFIFSLRKNIKEKNLSDNLRDQIIMDLKWLAERIKQLEK